MNETVKILVEKVFLITSLAAALLSICVGSAAFAQTPSSSGNKGEQTMNLKNSKILIAYFSHSGNTRALAGQLQKTVGGDVFEIVTAEPYPDEYRPTTVQARRELDENRRPALTSKVEDMAAYDVIFLGYPNWWGTMPMAVFSFVEQYDLSGKTIVPFCTHEGSRLGRSVSDLTRLAPGSTLLSGFEIKGSQVERGGDGLRAWLLGLGLIEP